MSIFLGIYNLRPNEEFIYLKNNSVFKIKNNTVLDLFRLLATQEQLCLLFYSFL